MALRENLELRKSYVREPCWLGPIQATQKPSLVASVEEHKPQTEGPSPTLFHHLQFLPCGISLFTLPDQQRRQSFPAPFRK